MCLGEVGTVIAVDESSALVRLADGRTSRASTAVLVADGHTLAPGDRIVISMGFALRCVDPDAVHEPWR